MPWKQKLEAQNWHIFVTYTIKTHKLHKAVHYKILHFDDLQGPHYFKITEREDFSFRGWHREVRRLKGEGERCEREVEIVFITTWKTNEKKKQFIHICKLLKCINGNLILFLQCYSQWMRALDLYILMVALVILLKLQCGMSCTDNDLTYSFPILKTNELRRFALQFKKK